MTFALSVGGWRLAEAVSFFTLDSGMITRLVEYWPEPYAPPYNRGHLAEPIG